MLTPQDIQNQEFAKAVFGGYDMAAVDDFLEQLAADYTALYKDNMVLKGKLKVLVEKVEEYRSTEDAMRMALPAAPGPSRRGQRPLWHGGAQARGRTRARAPRRGPRRRSHGFRRTPR